MTTSPPTILLACPGLANTRCGIGSYTHDFARGLQLVGCNVVLYGGPLLGLYDRVLECRPDMVHIQYEYGWASSARLIIIRDMLKRIDVPLVATFHTVAEGAPQNRVLPNVILHHQSFSKNFIGSVSIVPLAIPDIQANPNALVIPRRKNVTLVGWLGNVFYHKGLDWAIRTYGYNREQELLVIGSEGVNSESYYRKCRQLAEETQEGKVYWYNRVMPANDVVAHLVTCDLIVFPYVEYGSTGCSSAVRLAFNAGVPCVVSHTSHFQDLLELTPRPVGTLEEMKSSSLEAANQLRTAWSFPAIAMRTIMEVYAPLNAIIAQNME